MIKNMNNKNIAKAMFLLWVYDIMLNILEGVLYECFMQKIMTFIIRS